MATQYDDFLTNARARGYTDPEIRSGMLRSGWSQDQVLRVLPGEPEGFLGESGLSGVGDLVGRAGSGLASLPGGLRNVPAVAGGLWDTLKGIVQGQAEETRSEAGKASGALQNLFTGTGGIGQNLNDALVHTIGAVPLVGHPASHAITNTQDAVQKLLSGDTGGALKASGAAGGDILSLFGPEIAKGISGRAIEGISRTGEKMYHHPLTFDTNMYSPEDIEEGVREGLRQGLPAQNLFAKAGQRSLDTLGDTGKPGTIMGNLEAATQPYVTGAAGAAPVSAEIVLQPLLSKIQKSLGTPTTTGIAKATTMLDTVRPSIREMDPQIESILWDPNAHGKGVPFSTAERTRLLDAWAKNTHTLTVEKAHTFKRNIYDTISDQAYKDNSGGVLAGETNANVLLAAGLKNAVNEVHPEVGAINDQMHNLLTLRSALRQAAVTSPKDFAMATHAVIGTLAGSVSGMAGHMSPIEIAPGTAVGLAALQALKNPRMATQLGIILGQKIPAVAEALRPFLASHVSDLTQRVLGQGGRLGNDPVKDLFEPQPK